MDAEQLQSLPVQHLPHPFPSRDTPQTSGGLHSLFQAKQAGWGVVVEKGESDSPLHSAHYPQSTQSMVVEVLIPYSSTATETDVA